MENGIDFGTIEKIIGFIVVLAGIIGGLITTISVANKSLIETKSKASEVRDTVKIAKQKADIEKEVARIDMVTKMEALYDHLAEDMNKKFSEMQIEMNNKSIQHETEICEIKALLEKVTGERDTYKKANLKLIHAIEEGVTLRAKMSADLNNCSACIVADQKLLITLKEVKVLFENGVKVNV